MLGIAGLMGMKNIRIQIVLMSQKLWLQKNWEGFFTTGETCNQNRVNSCLSRKAASKSYNVTILNDTSMFVDRKIMWSFFPPMQGVTSIPNLSRKTSKWGFRFNPPIHPWKRQMWPNILDTIGNRTTANGRITIPWQLYSIKMGNITIKTTN